MASTKYLQSGKTFFASLPNFHQTNDGLPHSILFVRFFFKNGPVDNKQMFNV